MEEQMVKEENDSQRDLTGRYVRASIISENTREQSKLIQSYLWGSDYPTMWFLFIVTATVESCTAFWHKYYLEIEVKKGINLMLLLSNIFLLNF